MPLIRHALQSAVLALPLCLAAPHAMADSFPFHKHQPSPLLSLQASASTDVLEDQVTIILAADIEGKDQAAVDRRLTEILNETRERAGSPSDIRLRTGAWRIWPSTDRDGRITVWRGRVELVLESRNIAAAADLAGKLGNPMAIANVNFDLSSEARAEAEEALLEEVAQAFQQRAEAAAEAFGFSGYKVHKLELGGSGMMPQPRGEMMMARASGMADDAPPALEPGETTVSLSVQGEVVLQTTTQRPDRRRSSAKKATDPN